MDPAPSTPFAGELALVTGASGGIGGAIAIELARRGAGLALLGRDRARLDAVAAAARDAGGRAEAFPIDLVDGAIDETVRSVRADLGPIALLVHSAGIFHLGSVAETPLAELDRQLAVNLRAPYRLTRLLLDDLTASHGQIVFVNTTAVIAPGAGTSAYTAAKAGLRAVADSLRAETNERGVRVLTVFPGRTASEMQRQVCEAEGVPYAPERCVQPQDVADAVVAALALPRTAELTEMTIRPMMKG